MGRLIGPIFHPPRPYPGVRGYLPSQLLRAEHAIVPFMGRDEVARDLDDWCQGGGARVRVVHGPGGAGKTRLALELAARRAMEGWRAGPLAWRALEDAALDELFRDPIPLFLVADCSETRPAEVAQVLRRLADQRETASARVLLLARGMGDWWRNLHDAVAELEGLAWGSMPVQVGEVAGGHEHARLAARAFADCQGVAAPPDVPDRGSTPLERQVEALVAVLGAEVKGFEGLLCHERGYLSRAAGAAGVTAARARLLPRFMALCTLAGGWAAEEGAGWATRLRGLGDLGEGEAVQVTDLLTSLYPRASGGIDGVRPDRVGEALVADGDQDGSLALTAVDRGRARQALTVLTRLGAAGHDAPLRALVEARRGEVPEAALEVAQETGDPAGRVLAESLERRPDPELCGRLDRLLPEHSVALRELATWVTRTCLDALPAGQVEERARLANNLGNRLSELGRREEALAAAREAADLYRQLARARPDAFLPDLAMSLGALGAVLRAAGRQVDAATSVREGLEAIGPHFHRLPAAFAGLTAALVGDYVSVCEEAGTVPDEALLAPFRSALGRLKA